MSHHRTGIVSPAATANADGPSVETALTTGDAGVAAPSHGNAGTSARCTYSDAICPAIRSLSAKSAARRKWMWPGSSFDPVCASRIVAICV